MRGFPHIQRHKMRRSHTKSRKGCTNCKRRKVKCDEVYPICFNCKRHQTPCSLSEQTPDSPDRSSQPPATTHKSEEEETAAGCGHASPAKISLAEQIAPFPSQELWSSDIELMHHWTTITADSLSIRPDMCYVWCVTIPREGYRHPFVMHGILALSAIHKSFLLPQDRKRYRALSDYHQAVGSEGFRSTLQSIDSENSMALFGFATCLVAIMMAQPSQHMDGQINDPLHRFMELVSLLRGFKTTLAPLIPRILQSEFAPFMHGGWPMGNDNIPECFPSLEHSLLPIDTWEAIQQLRDFQKVELPSASCPDYLESLQYLEDSARLIARAGPHAETGTVMAWIPIVKQSVLLDIAAEQPHGLLVLAYYCVFWATLDKTFWYTRGWPRLLFNAIEAKLTGEKKFMDMLIWPREKLIWMRL